MITGLEVLDTAVKVGLGAAISAVATIAVGRRSHSQDLTRERLRRRRDLLERAAQEVETFTHALLRYWALITEHVRYRAANGTMPADRQAMLATAKSDLWTSFGQLTSAEASLLLLGEKSAQTLLRAFGESARLWRATAHADNQALTEEALAGSRKDLLVAREAFFEALAAAYRPRCGLTSACTSRARPLAF